MRTHAFPINQQMFLLARLASIVSTTKVTNKPPKNLHSFRLNALRIVNFMFLNSLLFTKYTILIYENSSQHTITVLLGRVVAIAFSFHKENRKLYYYSFFFHFFTVFHSYRARERNVDVGNSIKAKPQSTTLNSEYTKSKRNAFEQRTPNSHTNILNFDSFLSPLSFSNGFQAIFACIIMILRNII